MLVEDLVYNIQEIFTRLTLSQALFAGLGDTVGGRVKSPPSRGSEYYDRCTYTYIIMSGGMGAKKNEVEGETKMGGRIRERGVQRSREG